MRAPPPKLPVDPEKAGKFLYWWLLLALFFEYARPSYQYTFLQPLRLNTVIPMGLLLVSLLSGGQRSWKEITADGMWKWPFVFVAFVLVSMSWASVTTYAYNTFMLILGYLILFVLVTRIATTRRRLGGIFVTLIAAHIFLIFYNPLVVTDPYTRHYITGATFLGDGNDFSCSLVLLIPFALELVMSESRKAWKIFYGLLLTLVILAIVGTQSRGATLGMITVFGYLWWRSPNKGRGVAAIVVAAMAVLAYAPDVYFSRMKTLKNPEQESSAEARLQAWRAGARMATDHALGVGAGNFPNNFPKYRSSNAPVRWMTAHSMYFLALGELGVLGLLLVLNFIFGNVWSTAKLRTRVSKLTTGPPEKIAGYVRLLNMMSAGALGLSISGAFLSVTYYPHLFMLTGLCISARCIVAREFGLSTTENETGQKKLPVRRRAATAP
jgi:probable O-glycosylation ligase (exosortase A-associated)